MSAVHLDIPDLRTVRRHAAPRFIEGTMIAGLVWVYSAILVRAITRRPIPGILLLGALTITARTVIALASGSVVVYFLQPSLGTMLVAGAFLLSVPLDKPLAGRLAADFCPLPDDVHANTHVRRFFRQVSLLWAFAWTAQTA